MARRLCPVVVALWLASVPGLARNYYVSMEGSDSNSGARGQPFRTIQRAADVAGPGDDVVVSDGTYRAGSSGPGSKLAVIARGGRPGQPVTFRAEHKWRAVLDGAEGPTGSAFDISKADYVTIRDFEIRGFASTAGGWGIENNGGSNITIIGNHIHDIGRMCTDTKIGMVGIYLSQGPVLIEQNLVHDIGRYAPGENGCNVAGSNYQTHDHGIYINGANDVTIRNNVFYNNQRGWSVHVYPKPVDRLLIVNNTFAFANPWRPGQIFISVPVTHSRISNNIFYQSQKAAIYFDPTNGTLPAMDTLAVTNNVSTNAVSEIYAPATRLPTNQPAGAGFSQNRENTDPLLVSPASFDFRIASGSPAARAGLTLKDVVTDFAGSARAQPPSVGAYELPAKLSSNR